MMKNISVFLVLAIAFGSALGAEPYSESENENPSPTPPISRESYDNPLVRIETSMGNIILELFPDEAPETVANFLGLAEGSKAFTDPESGEQVMRPLYDGTIFHRVIDNFMIQGGSPTGLGNGGPGFSFKDEINARSLGLDKMKVMNEEGYPHPYLSIQGQRDFQIKVLQPLYRKLGISSQEQLEEQVDAVSEAMKNLSLKENYENQGYQYLETVISRAPTRGVIAMANSGPNTNGSQFFINLVDTEWLTGKHTVFGKVRSGMDVVDAIGKVAVDGQSRPLEEVKIISIRRIEENSRN